LLEMYFSSTIQSEPCTLGLPSYQITEEPLWRKTLLMWWQGESQGAPMGENKAMTTSLQKW
jgi:hypothetical protein